MDADAGFLFYPHMQQKSLIIDLAIFLAANLDGGKKVWKGIISYQRQMFGQRFTNSFNLLHRQFRPYFRCYVNFVMKNPINGRESKKIIREVENLPEFLKSLSWTGGDFIIYTFVLFLEGKRIWHAP